MWEYSIVAVLFLILNQGIVPPDFPKSDLEPSVMIEMKMKA